MLSVNTMLLTKDEIRACSGSINWYGNRDHAVATPSSLPYFTLLYATQCLEAAIADHYLGPATKKLCRSALEKLKKQEA